MNREEAPRSCEDIGGRVPFANGTTGSGVPFEASSSSLVDTLAQERVSTFLTLGIDLAAEPDRTWLAALAWSPGRVEVIALCGNVDDTTICTASAHADKVGIDCPLGWPEAFVDMVCAHRDGTIAAPITFDRERRRPMVLRETDLDVRARTGITPLSVSADRIAHVAMRCAGLQATLAQHGIEGARDGTGRIAEVYPAAALNTWGLPFRRYKRPEGGPVRETIVNGLSAASWLSLGPFADQCRESDDALDAVVSALVAYAVAAGTTHRPPEGSRARTEGWIHLPTTPLDHTFGQHEPLGPCLRSPAGALHRGASPCVPLPRSTCRCHRGG